MPDDPDQPRAARAMRLRQPRKAWPAALALVAATGLAAYGGASAGSATTTRAPAAITVAPTARSAAAGGALLRALESAFVGVIQKVEPEVVQVSNPSGLGSGIVFDAGGDIVTNDHVV